MPDRSPVHVPEAERIRELEGIIAAYASPGGLGEVFAVMASMFDKRDDRIEELQARVAVAESVAEELEKKAAEAAWLGSINVASIGVSPRWLRSLAARLRGPAE